jgi:Tol biopolymer transport system component
LLFTLILFQSYVVPDSSFNHPSPKESFLDNDLVFISQAGRLDPGWHAPGALLAGTTTRVSIASDGAQGNRVSYASSISADGRYVVFASHANNLVPGDTNGAADIFVHDRQTGQTSRVSVASNGTQGNSKSYGPSISADGRYVAFHSDASNLVPGDTNGTRDVFVHDRQTGQTSRVSVASSGTQGNGTSYSRSLSADGRYVVFYSHANNLVPGDTNGRTDVFVHDRQMGQTSRVSVASDGAQGNDWSYDPFISADGRYVVFASYASNLVPGDTNGTHDIFVHDRQTGQTSRVSVASNGAQGNDWSQSPSISADGRYVAFYSDASNLVPGDTNGVKDVFVHDRQTAQTTRISITSNGTQGNGESDRSSISADGRYVAFQSWAQNLVPGDTNVKYDIFVHDRQTGLTSRVSVASNGAQGNGESGYPSISADGRYVAFHSDASNLVPGDINGVLDVFVHDRGNTHCNQANPNRQPLLFVTGWSGSRLSASQDEQIGFFFGAGGHLAPYGYIEGCNLFYAEATSPYLWLADNGEVIRDNLCLAYAQVKAFNPTWNGRFDIIAHSYGGLRARAYLENSNLYGKNCPGTQNRVIVDNLFTMGTPHGGEPYPLPTFLLPSLLPFAGVIGLCAVVYVPDDCEDGGGQWPALVEMQPATRLAQNLSSSQPAGVCYHLLSGDARLQSTQFPWKLTALTDLFPSTYLTANDLAVHRSSAAILNSFPYSWKYPRTIPVYTHDLHGHATAEQIGSHNLRSFVYPADTFVEKILDYLGQRTCSAGSQSPLPANDKPTVMALLAQQTEAQVVPGLPLMDVSAGSLANDESVSGNFTLTGAGPSQVMLSWTTGDVSLSLLDPNGTLIDATTAPANPNVDYLSLDTGFGLMATYLITNTVNGVWQYTISANGAAPAAAYRLVVLPPTPIAVSPSLPQWLPNDTPVVITATVAYSEATPVIGGAVAAQIIRPGGTIDMISLYDDGNHHDGQANDGVFGGVYAQTADGGVYGLLVTATGVYDSEAYTRTATAYFTIAPAGATLSGAYSDQGVDETGNGVYEWLEVSAQIAVTEAATYTLSADLYAGETFITHARQQVYLNHGQQTIAILFDGAAIFEKGLDGPYTIRNALLLEESPLTLLIETADNVHVTQAYRYTDFGQHMLYLPAILRQ